MRCHFVTMLSLFGVLCLRPALADGIITFNDLTDPPGTVVNGGITVTSTNFGALACATPVLSGALEVCTVAGTLPTNVTSLSVTNINIYESNGIDVSDTLTVTTTPGLNVGGVVLPSTFTATFTSDSGIPLTALVGNLLGGPQLIENGSVLDAFTVGGLTFRVASDIDAPVPEPASILLLGTVLAGVALIMRRRSRKA